MKIKIENIKLKSEKVEIGRTYDKCLAWFFAYPKIKTGLTELSLSIQSSKTATKEAVEALLKREFLLREIVGKAWILSVNQKHRYFVARKMPYHLDRIYQSGIVEAVYRIIPQAKAIILFGSYRWGSDDEKSDIDIAVEVLGNKELKITRLGIIERLGYRKKVPVNLHIFSRNKIDLNLFANIVNGIVLDGFLEVKV